MNQMKRSIESLNNEILQHLYEGTMQSWLLEMKQVIPQNVVVKENVSSSGFCLNKIATVIESNDGYFFLPCFELVIDPTNYDTQTIIGLVEEHFDIREISIQNNLLHLVCEWFEGDLVSNKEHIVHTATRMSDDVQARLETLSTAIVKIAPMIDIVC